MIHYSLERKAAVIQKMMPPTNMSISRLAAETGITQSYLYNWRKQAKSRGIAVPNAEQWSSADKLALVLETAALLVLRKKPMRSGGNRGRMILSRDREMVVVLINEAVGIKPLVLHSDNGSPMKGASLMATLDNLGIASSYSRPRVNNDNAFAAARFSQ